MGSPPPDLMWGAFSQARKGLKAHAHAVGAFGSPDELGRILGVFLREGLDASELNVFLHSFASDEEAREFVLREPTGFGGDERQLVVVQLHSDVFESELKVIDYERVAHAVSKFSTMATERGLTGVRIFVDASSAYLSTGRADEWFAFEGWLGKRLKADVGLVCAYSRADLARAEVISEVLRTHAYRFGDSAEK